jgi:heme exporter protein A
MPAAEGTVSWDGADVARDREAHRARLAYLGHQDALKGGLTALENLQFWASFNGGNAEAALKRSASRSSPTGRRAPCRRGRSGGWP